MDKSTETILWLKDFSKSWVNIVSDEVVYCEQVSELKYSQVVGFNRRTTYIKEYSGCHLWLEILFKIRMAENLDLYAVLIEASEATHPKKLRMSQSSRDINSGRHRQDNPMLINNINSMKNPERVHSLLPIRSIIRLKRLDISPNVLTQAIEPIDEFRAFLNVDWEDCEFITLDSESPSDVIKGGAQSVNNFAYQKAPGIRSVPCEIKVEDIVSILRVYINSNSVRLTCDEGFNFSVEDIKVFLRPVDTSEGVCHWLHMLSPCE